MSAHLAAFDAMHAEKRRQAAALEGVADEDGFITVTRKRRGGGGGIGDDDENNTDVANGRRNKKKKVELVDFYRFQMRETKRQRKGLEDTLWREEIESDREGE